MASTSSSEQSNRKSMIRGLFEEDDPNPLFDLLDGLFSEDQAVFNSADSFFKDVVKEFPGDSCRWLAKVLEQCPSPISRIRCSSLLSRFLANNWPNITPFIQDEIKAVFIQRLQEESDPQILKSLCTCIARLGAVLFPKEEWPEMCVVLESVPSSAHPARKFAHAILLGELIPKFPEVFSPSVDVLCDSFQKLMDHHSGNDEIVRAATLGAAVKLILHLAKPSSQDAYSNLLTQMISVLMDMQNDYLTSQILDQMIALGRAQPRFFAAQVKSSVETMLEIISDERLKPKTRQLGVQFLVVLAEDGCGMIQKLSTDLIEKMLTQLLILLVGVEDYESWGLADDDTEAGTQSLSYYAEEAWSRLAIALRGEVILESCPELLREYLEDGNWKKQYAGVTVLGLITSSCSKKLIPCMEGSVNKTMELLIDHHPRVCLAAFHTIGEFSKYLWPSLQEEYHKQIIPALLKAIINLDHPRLQMHAAKALLLFSQNCYLNILQPYMDDIVKNLLVLLEEDREARLKEAAMEALASLAESTKDEFQTFYDAVLSSIRSLLETAKADSDYKLLAHTLKCIAVIAVAVGKRIAKDDVEEVVKSLMFLQDSNCGKDGSIRSHILLAWGGASLCLGAEFFPFLRGIQSAKRTEYPDHNRNSIILKEKFLACNTFGNFAGHVKGGLCLWIKEVLDTVLYAMDNQLPIPDLSDSPLITLSETIIPALLEALQEPSIKFQVIILKALNQSIKVQHTCICKEMATEIVKEISKVLFACFKRKALRELICNNSSSNLRTEELLKEESGDEDKLYTQIHSCLRSLVERLKASFLPLLDDLLPILEEHVWRNDKACKEREIALSVFHDIVENCGEEAFRHYDKCIPLILESCSDKNPNLQEIAARAIGIYADIGGEVLKQLHKDGFSSLESIFLVPESLCTPETVLAREVAIFTYGKLLSLLTEEESIHKHALTWILKLPIKHNLDIAKATHSLFCSMVEKPESMVTGPDGLFISYIVESMAKVLLSGEGLTTQKTHDKMIQQLEMLWGEVKEHEIKTIHKKLSGFVQVKLQDILPQGCKTL